MFEKVLSASAAAKQLGIHVRTAQRWATQYEKDSDSIFKTHKKNGRPRILIEEHKKVILENLRDLKISKSTLYEFVWTQCNLTLKKARFQSVDGISEAKIQEHLDWVRRWETTDMDFRKTCVFLDGSAFHINMKRSMAWSKNGSPAVVIAPKTRAKTTTILGAISVSGLIECSLRLPQLPAKKRKRGGHVDLTSTELSGYAPIHKSEDIQKWYAYLPSYSPELNPIEQFWSVVKSKVKRNRLLERQTLMTRISEASNSLRLSDFEEIEDTESIFRDSRLRNMECIWETAGEDVKSNLDNPLSGK
ncbi:hypothetical protein VTP01DRAFT_8657 [Rhizomucor pusillus]|uniref:uncharacterized protein n=1 Tax=Rhizomucor pusillus TaxID=4840 RepID=UPI00374321B8